MFLFSKEKFQKQTKKLIYAVFRPGQANMILQIGGKSNEIFGGFIIGKIIDSLIIGVICFIGLSILNMPYTMLVSVIVGVTNVIPFFGTVYRSNSECNSDSACRSIERTLFYHFCYCIAAV